MNTARNAESYFEYFEGNYRWSMGLLLALATPYGGSDLGEVNAIGRALKTKVGDDQAWVDEWCRMGDRLYNQAREWIDQGRTQSAASAALRACTYYQVGERFAIVRDTALLDAYRRSLESFQMFIKYGHGPTIETVEVPYEAGSSLPAYFVRPIKEVEGRPTPCVVFFDGLDITKELQYLRGVEELSRRGIACLVVDGPGNGESIRFRNMPLRYDYEAAGSAAYDYLDARADVDSSRVAVMGISLGGYFAPRCAARDSRFAACVAWGAMWDYHERWATRIGAGFDIPMSVAGEHIAWTMGTKTPEEALVLLEDWRLEGVARDIEMPFLIVHGEDDQQVPLADAEALLREVSSVDKTLKVYPKGKPGDQHCQVDHPAVMVEIADWLQAKLCN